MNGRRRLTSLLAALALAAAAFDGNAQDRLPPLSTDQLSEEQAHALAEFVDARGQPTGPWIALLRSPKLMTRTRALSDYLQRQSGRLLGENFRNELMGIRAADERREARALKARAHDFIAIQSALEGIAGNLRGK